MRLPFTAFVTFFGLGVAACSSSPPPGSTDGSTIADTQATPGSESAAIPAKTVALAYRSAGNGTARIAIDLFTDMTFTLHFETLPEMGDVEEVAEPYTLDGTGTWTQSGDWMTMDFGDDGLRVADLFDFRYADKTQFKLAGQHAVEINTSYSFLTIYGVRCEKTVDQRGG